MQVSVSFGDFPLLRNQEYLFAELKEAGADSIELITGIKSRFHFQKVLKLSEKYDLPITSIHQPAWSILPGFFDEGFVREGTQIGVKKFVFHPVSQYAFSDPHMEKYLEHLALVQKKFDVTVMLENLPQVFRPNILGKLFPVHPDTYNFTKLLSVMRKYELHSTLDISHALSLNPASESWFDELFPHIANIHLSSFDKHHEHLPVYMGDFQTKDFIIALKKRKYAGLLNLEIFYPNVLMVRNYDFSVIQKSIEYIKEIID